MDIWHVLTTVVYFASSSSTDVSLFNEERVIFSSPSKITKLLVQADDKQKIRAESDTPSIFFTLIDPRFDGGSCIYVLEDLAAYEVLEGGRDSTVDYGSDRNVYFGSKDGVYRYHRETLSARKLGPFRDSIVQLQKANGTDKIYFLTEHNKLFELENEGTIRTEVKAVTCATQFVLDTSNNIYYVQCKTEIILILKHRSSLPKHVLEDFFYITLLRPPFIMDESIPLIGDGTLHILYANGTCDTKDFFIEEKPTAYSVDTALYMVVALNGKIYEYNVMEVLLKSMYGLGPPWPTYVNKIVVSLIGSSKDVFGSYKGYYYIL